MAFENKTIEDVNSLIINGLEAELNTKFRLLPKAFVRVLAKVLSGIYISLYRQQAWMFLQMFVATASFDEIEVLGRKIRPLVLWGQLVGIGEPGSATQFEGKIKVKASAINTYLNQGTQFVSRSTGEIYYTTETILLRDEYNIVSVRCAESGVIGNLVVGDMLDSVSPYNNINRQAECVEVSLNAVDPEDEASYRARVESRWRVQPQGGALNDYRKWASDVPGVLQTYIYKDDNTAAGVLIYVVANTDSRIPTSEMLIQVGKACTYNPETGEGRKPIGAILDPANNETYSNIRPCSIKKFDVYITGYSMDEYAAFSASVKSNVSAYFKQREPFVRGLSVDNDRYDRISSINVSGICNDIAEGVSGHFDSVQIKKDGVVVSSYVLGRGELSELKDIYINGVKV
ncbi:baseplate J/gp47 family protein [Carnobacterium sp.]|uniref:baseplate J/gp47 family protein n=1 Tax=Carnobacterium sp. TaxID=48221 RepID=UPI00388DEAA4